MRDPLNEKRKGLIELAFARLDLEGNGFVSAEHLKERYSVDQHPDFISGKKTRFECIQDSASVRSGGEQDGKVTVREPPTTTTTFLRAVTTMLISGS